MEKGRFRGRDYLLLNLILFLFFESFISYKGKELKNESPFRVIRKDSVPSYLHRNLYKTKINGKMIDLYHLENKAGLKISILNYGARIVSILIPDKKGVEQDIIMGPGSIQEYLDSQEPYFGATIGRYGNRIAKGQFYMDGKGYQIPINNGPNALHGGPQGFHRQIWKVISADKSRIHMQYISPDGEEGFPGNLKVDIIYSLNDQNELKIDYEAETDQKTILNLTNHAFFNLNGIGQGDILNHELKIEASLYTPVDSSLIPMGNFESVENTPFDFRKFKRIGESIKEPLLQLKMGNGYDHNFVLTSPSLKIPVAEIMGDLSGIRMQIFTTEPGLQFYSGNFMNSKNLMKGGHRDDFRTAFALETQHFPDSPNHPNFPNTYLKPGEKFHSISIYKFISSFNSKP